MNNLCHKVLSIKKISTILLISMFLIACGGGGKTPPQAKEKAIEKITAYAKNGSKPVPTLQDYLDAGVTGVTAENLDKLNIVVDNLEEADVDTTAELDALTVQLENNPPVVTDASATTNEDTAKDITLSASDADGDTLIYSVVASPSNGVVSFAGNVATYTPNLNYNGSNSFSYKVNDGTVDSNIGTVDISVTAENDEPIANAGSDISVAEGQTITLIGSGIDPDIGDTKTYSWSPATDLNNANIAQPDFTAPIVSVDTDQVLTLMVSDSGGSTDNDTVNITILNLPAQPQNVQAEVGDTIANLTWDEVSDATGYDICVATETITDPTNCSSFPNGALQIDQTSPAVVSGLTNGVEYFFVLIPTNTNGSGAVSVEVTAKPTNVAQPSPTGLLNDTGIGLCGDYAYDGNNILISGHTHTNTQSCTSSVDSEGDPIPAGQDGHSGRDVMFNDDSDGHSGFSFTKISDTGTILPGYATSWSCIKDNITGLIWENKTVDGGLHDKDDRYTWYNTDETTNGGFIGYARHSDSSHVSPFDSTCSGYVGGTANTYCNTQAYVARVNISGWCGANNWRMPTNEELSSIVDDSIANPGPTIDANFFPNTHSSLFWSSSPYVLSSDYAWSVGFSYGDDGASYKHNYGRVRLVRGGQ